MRQQPGGDVALDRQSRHFRGRLSEERNPVLQVLGVARCTGELQLCRGAVAGRKNRVRMTIVIPPAVTALRSIAPQPADGQ